MKRIWRLLLYVRPYALYSLASVVLMAVVGAMAAFRILLVKPIFDNVLSPEAPPGMCWFSRFHILGYVINLQFLVPSHFHNAWTVVAYALVVSALLKSVCDYFGTYLVNYAGFGMITDLRNDLVQRCAAALGGVFSEAHDGNAAVDADQRHREGPVCDVECAERFSAAVLYAASSRRLRW